MGTKSLPNQVLFPLVAMCFGFQKQAGNTHASSNNVGLDHIGFNIVYQTIQHS
jgi:hypothetical protein